MRPCKYDHAQIISLHEQGYSAKQIKEMIGAKSIDHLRKVIWLHKHGNDVRPQLVPGAKTETPVKLDRGKVLALSNAGWDVEKIYDEFSGRYPIEEIKEAISSHGKD